MAERLLTPITLWSDFDETLPLDEEVISEEENVKEVYFYGRQTEQGRVKIYARMYSPVNAEEYPAVMVFFDAGSAADIRFVEEIRSAGYGVLCVDYCGDDGTERHTVYPDDIDYANFVRAGRRYLYVDETAKQTSWYEWAAVARYAVRYLREKPEITKVGAIGLRTGGEVLWKITPFSPLDCFVCVGAGGWLAYRNVKGVGEDFDEERCRFIAGIDSQSYAPFAKCPVLFLCGANDKKYNCDRIYDTFARVNPEMDKAILYTLRGSGLLGQHCRVDMRLFLDRLLKGRSVFIGKPVDISVGEENGNLVVNCIYDRGGEIADCGVFYAAEADFETREWTRVLARPTEQNENVWTFPIDVFEGSGRILAFTYVRYTNGFSAASRILSIDIEKQYRNTRKSTRIIYSGRDMVNGFVPYRQDPQVIAGCFVEDSCVEVGLHPGYGGIMGISCGLGLMSGRVGKKWYLPPENAVFSFDVYSPFDRKVTVEFVREEDGVKTTYANVQEVKGKGKWKRILISASEFKTATGVPMRTFDGVESLIFPDENVLINNVVWL